MLSTKPYLMRAIHEWCLDQGFTPYLQVVVDERCRVPREHVRDGQIVLNVSMSATNQLVMGNDEITFHARFSGAVFSVLVPIDCVVAIYARENGQGMAFDAQPAGSEGSDTDDANAADAGSDQSADTPAEPDPKPTGGRSHLTRIK